MNYNNDDLLHTNELMMTIYWRYRMRIHTAMEWKWDGNEVKGSADELLNIKSKGCDTRPIWIQTKKIAKMETCA